MAYSTIHSSDICKCHTCGQPITFVANRNGKRYPVDVLMIQGQHCFKTGIGAHRNITPWHKCQAPPNNREQEFNTKAKPIQTALIEATTAMLKSQYKDVSLIEAWSKLDTQYRDLCNEYSDVTENK
jgi:hypothetical protein